MQSSMKQLTRVNFDHLFDGLLGQINILSYVSNRQFILMEKYHNQAPLNQFFFHTALFPEAAYYISQVLDVYKNKKIYE